MRPFPPAEWRRLVAPRRRQLAEPEHYVRALRWSPSARILDLGAGPGFFTAALLATLDSDGTITALDVEPAMLAHLEERLPHDPRLRCVRAPLSALPLDDASFDVCWCAFVAHELDDLAAPFAEARRVLCPGGVFHLLEWEPIPSEHGPPIEERVAAARLIDALEQVGFAAPDSFAVTGCQYLISAAASPPS